MRHLATIRTVSALRPIEGADRIEVAQIDGWECVVKKDEFHIGEPIVYIEIDSVCPETPAFEFLRDRKFRVRTIKLRGQISQGLVMPLSILSADKTYSVGDDVTDVLGITKYDPEAQREKQELGQGTTKAKNPAVKFLMRYGWFRRLRKKFVKQSTTDFPNWIAKTDETRIQNLPQLFAFNRDSHMPFYVTEKMDGQSATYYLRKVSKKKYEFGVCSRNRQILIPDNSSYWTVAKQFHIEQVLRALVNDGDYVVLQGEICGNGIQGNKYGIEGYKFFAFNLLFPGSPVLPTPRADALLGPFGIPTVPILERSYVLPDTISELVEYAKGTSVMSANPKQKREGLVLRSTDGQSSFKVINPEYLLDSEKETE